MKSIIIYFLVITSLIPIQWKISVKMELLFHLLHAVSAQYVLFCKIYAYHCTHYYF